MSEAMKDADSVKQYFTNHINTVASHFDGKNIFMGCSK
jgi:hypothetical protein